MIEANLWKVDRKFSQPVLPLNFCAHQAILGAFQSPRSHNRLRTRWGEQVFLAAELLRIGAALSTIAASTNSSITGFKLWKNLLRMPKLRASDTLHCRDLETTPLIDGLGFQSFQGFPGLGTSSWQIYVSRVGSD